MGLLERELDEELMRRALPSNQQQEVQEQFGLVRSFLQPTSVARQLLQSEFLSKTSAAIGNEFGANPSVEGELRETLARKYLELGMPAEALAEGQRELSLLGGNANTEARAVLTIVQALADLGRPHDAQEQLSQWEAGLGGQESDPVLHWEALLASTSLHIELREFDSARARLDEAGFLLEGQQDPQPRNQWRILDYRAELAFAEGEYALAQELARQALQGAQELFDPTSRQIMGAANRLISVLGALDLLPEAILMAERVLKQRQESLGDDHPIALTAQANLGALLAKSGELDRSHRVFLEALARSEKTRGRLHLDTLIILTDIGDGLDLGGQPRQAMPYLQRAVDGLRLVAGAQAEPTLNALNALGIAHFNLGSLDLAEHCWRETLTGFTAILGSSHPQSISAKSNLALLLRRMGKLEDAKALSLEVLESHRTNVGESHQSNLIALCNHGALLRELSLLSESEEFISKAIHLGEESLGEGHWYLGQFLIELGRTQYARKNYAASVASLERGYALVVAQLGESNARAIEAAEGLTTILTEWNHLEESDERTRQIALWKSRSERGVVED